MMKQRSLAPALPTHLFALTYTSLVLVSPALATPTVNQALALRPVQENIEFNQPVDKETCKLLPAEGSSGWVLLDGSGRRLRRFLDTDGDKKLDHWCYYQDGNEVYRDIDSDKNGRADQYRWLGSAGTRWGIDRDEDGTIDSWKAISAEELSEEVIEALKTKNRHRFVALLVSSGEIQTLGLSGEQEKRIKQITAEARKNFAKSVSKNNIGEGSTWTNFSATRPGTIGVGNNGVTRDIMVYENAVAMYHTDNKHDQLVLGTLLRVGESWRLTQLPTAELGDERSPGLFFTAAHESARREVISQAQADTQTQELLRELEDIDKALTVAGDPEKITRLNENRAKVLEKIIAGSTDKTMRENWIRQLADTLSAAVQTGSFPQGTERLEQLISRLQDSSDNAIHVPYVQFRYLSANYTRRLQEPKADFVKIQEQWLDDLESYVNEYPQSQDTGEAMLQLALAEEFAGQDDVAKQWYGRIVQGSNDKLLVAKATGANRRLTSVGKSLELKGATVEGEPFKLSSHRRKVVALHFWATWCEPCLEDMKDLKRLLAKYGSQGFTPIGVNLDADQATVSEFLTENRYPWPHIHETGGLDSRLANELGVLTLPIMLLIDRRGKVINRGLHAGELYDELEKLFE